jgi:hypothetical protein
LLRIAHNEQLTATSLGINFIFCLWHWYHVFHYHINKDKPGYDDAGVGAQRSTDPRQFHAELIGLSPLVVLCPRIRKAIGSGLSLLHLTFFIIFNNHA